MSMDNKSKTSRRSRGAVNWPESTMDLYKSRGTLIFNIAPQMLGMYCERCRRLAVEEPDEHLLGRPSGVHKYCRVCFLEETLDKQEWTCGDCGEASELERSEFAWYSVYATDHLRSLAVCKGKKSCLRIRRSLESARLSMYKELGKRLIDTALKGGVGSVLHLLEGVSAENIQRLCLLVDSVDRLIFTRGGTPCFLFDERS